MDRIVANSRISCILPRCLAQIQHELPQYFFRALLAVQNRGHIHHLLRCDDGFVRQAAVQQLAAVEVRALCDAVNLVQQLIHLLLQRSALHLAEGAVRGFCRKLDHAVQHFVHLGKVALRRLNQTDAVLRVARGGLQRCDLRLHFFADRKARSVVGRAVDAQARSQFFQALGNRVAVQIELAICVLRLYVCTDHHTVVSPSCCRSAVNFGILSGLMHKPAFENFYPANLSAPFAASGARSRSHCTLYRIKYIIRALWQKLNHVFAWFHRFKHAKKARFSPCRT